MRSAKVSGCLGGLIAGCLLSLGAFSLEVENHNAGMQAFFAGHYAEATEYFLKSIESPADKNDALVILARIAMAQGNDKLAADYLAQALTVAPETAEEIFLLGELYCWQAQQASVFAAVGLAKKCIAQYEAALAMEGATTEMLVAALKFHMGMPFIAGGSSKKGKAYLQQLEALSPEHANVYKIHELQRDGENSAALQLADELSAKGFQSAINQYEVAHYYRDNNAVDKAASLFESLVDASITLSNRWYIIDSLLQSGELALLEGNPKKAIKRIESYKAKNQNPGDPHYFWASWSLAKAYKMAGDLAQYNLLVNSIQAENYQADKAFALEFERDR